MDKHCKGCANWHNAGHPKKSPLVYKYNDWCTKFGGKASSLVGLSHSAWWLCERKLCQGVYIDFPIRKFKEADYK